MFGWFKKKQTKEQKEQALINCLFPPLELHELNGIQYHVDKNIDSLLQSVLSDLEEGINDDTVRKSIQNAINRIIEVRKIYNEYPILDKNAKYIMVDNLDKFDPENIKPIE